MVCDHRAFYVSGGSCGFNHALPDAGLVTAVVDAFEADFCIGLDRLSFHLSEKDQTNEKGCFQMDLNPITHLE